MKYGKIGDAVVSLPEDLSIKVNGETPEPVAEDAPEVKAHIEMIAQLNNTD